MLIAGVPTVVEMQALALADGAGNIIDSFQDYEFHRVVVEELRRVRAGLQALTQKDLTDIPP